MTILQDRFHSEIEDERALEYVTELTENVTENRFMINDSQALQRARFLRLRENSTVDSCCDTEYV